MMKNILTILFLFLSVFSFAQNRSSNTSVDSRTDSLISLLDTPGNYINSDDRYLKIYNGEVVFNKLPLFVDSVSTHPFLRNFRKGTSDGSFEIGLNFDSRGEFQHTPNALRKRLAQVYEYGGFGYVNFGYSSATNLNVVLNGGIVIDKAGIGLQSMAGKARVLQNTGESYSINTVNEFGKFSEINIYYYRQTGGGSFTITIDGALNQTVNTSGANSVQKISITSLTDTNHSVVFESTGGGDVVLLEYDLKRNNNGFRIHNIANSGASSSNFANDFTNTHFYTDNTLDLVIIRLGVNGGDMANETTANVGATNHETISNRIKAVSPNTDILYTGEGDNGTYSVEQVKVYNNIMKNKANSNTVAFANMFEIIPEWSDFNVQGLGDASVHENAEGGYLIGDWYIDFLVNGKYELTSSQNVTNGTINRVAYYSDTDEISSSNIYTDADRLIVNGTSTNQSVGLSVQGNNEQIASFGFGSTNPFFSLNDKAGYLSLNWFAKYEHPEWVSVNSAIRPSQITRDVNALRFNYAELTPAGNNILWRSLFVANIANRFFNFVDPSTQTYLQILNSKTAGYNTTFELADVGLKIDQLSSSKFTEIAFAGTTKYSFRNTKAVLSGGLQLDGLATTPVADYYLAALDANGNADWKELPTGGGGSLWEADANGIIPSGGVDNIGLGMASISNRSIATSGNVQFNGMVLGVSGGASILNSNTGNFTITSGGLGGTFNLKSTDLSGVSFNFFTNEPDAQYSILSGNVAFNAVGQSGTPGSTLHIRSDGNTSTTESLRIDDSDLNTVARIDDDGNIMIQNIENNGYHQFTNTFPVDGTGVGNGSFFLGTDNLFYKKDGTGLVSPL